jgi:hypothetical protein
MSAKLSGIHPPLYYIPAGDKNYFHQQYSYYSVQMCRQKKSALLK